MLWVVAVEGFFTADWNFLSPPGSHPQPPAGNHTFRSIAARASHCLRRAPPTRGPESTRSGAGSTGLSLPGHPARPSVEPDPLWLYARPRFGRGTLAASGRAHTSPSLTMRLATPCAFASWLRLLQ